MSQRIGTAGSAVTVELSVIVVAFRHTSSLSQANGVGLLHWMPGGHGMEFTVVTCHKTVLEQGCA